MGNEDLEELGDLSREVAGQHEQFREATAAERDAKGRLLRSIVDAAECSLQAITSRVCIGLDGVVQQWMKTPSSHALCISAFHGPQHKIGGVCGDSLYLTDDAQFVRLDYTGGTSSWSAALSELTFGEVVEKRYDVNVVAERIHEALLRQLDGRKMTRVAQMRERAEKFAAVAVLVRGM